MNKVTYLLGAGASCNALPMVKGFAERVSNFNDVLKPLVEEPGSGL
jgi:hypothetical protein